MIAEACRPPVFKREKLEAIDVIEHHEITVVLQYVEDLGNAAVCVGHDTGVQLAETDSGASRERSLRGSLRKDLHCDGAALLVKRVTETGFVVGEIVLTGGAKHASLVHPLDIGHGHSVAVLHDGEFPQPHEERLHMMWDANPERVIYRLRDTVLNRQCCALGELNETGGAIFGIPRSYAKDPR